jgi:riboflavin kinase/FMN adenylyltransferase
LTGAFREGDNVLRLAAIAGTAFRLIEQNRGIERRGSMSVISIDRIGEFPARARGAIVTVGNFDGVHLGHQRLMARVRAKAGAAGVPALAITFDPHPVALLRPEAAPVPLLWLEREIELLREAGASEVAVFRTGRWLLELSAREFFDRILNAQLGAKGIVEGPNFAFGHDRQGNVGVLGQWCAEARIDFEVVEGAVIDDRLISSSLIRQSVSQGRVTEAARFLGRPHRIRGSVGAAQAAARALGSRPSISAGSTRCCPPTESTRASPGSTAGDRPGRPHAISALIRPSANTAKRSRHI